MRRPAQRRCVPGKGKAAAAAASARGAVPGSKGSFVRITDAIKHARPDDVPYPAALKEGLTLADPDKKEAAPAEEAEDAPAGEEKE